jgi:hypothetical protein
MRKLAQVQLPENNGTSGFEPPHDLSVLARNAVGEGSAGSGGWNASGVDIVLEADRDSVQRATPVTAADLLIGCFGLSHRLLVSHRNKRMEDRIQLIYAIQACSCQLPGRDPPLRNQF